MSGLPETLSPAVTPEALKPLVFVMVMRLLRFGERRAKRAACEQGARSALVVGWRWATGGRVGRGWSRRHSVHGEARGLGEAEHEVGALHDLSGRALAEVVDRGGHDE